MLRFTLVAVSALACISSAAAGGFPCQKFVHNDDGSWRILEPLTIEGPGGRKIDFTPDETYTEGHGKEGLDMAKLLNANCTKK